MGVFKTGLRDVGPCLGDVYINTSRRFSDSDNTTAFI